MTADLAELFDLLVLPLAKPSENNLSAVPIPGTEAHRLAKDAGGSPCLLLKQQPTSGRPAPIRLQNLMVSYDVPCTITQPDARVERDIFTIIRCSNSDPRLFPHFLRIVSPIVVSLGPSPTTAAVRRAISGLVELFQALTAPAHKSIQGLWAELLLIAQSAAPVVVATAWHRTPEEHFDFMASGQRIEVKSASDRRREHHFSLAQLSPAGASRILVASLFVERAGGGLSLRRVFGQVRERVGHQPTLLAHLDSAFYSMLGSNWSEAMDESFDWELAVESLRFFDSSQVPKINEPIPAMVSDVRFRSDLSGSAPADAELMKTAGNLFSAVLRRGSVP